MAQRSTTSKQTPKPPEEYENNPFMLTLNGMNRFFRLAQSTAIVALVLSMISFLGNVPSSVNRYQNGGATMNLTASDLIVIAVIIGTLLLVVIIFSVVVRAVIDYTAAQIASGKRSSLRRALSAAIEHFGEFFWLQIQIFVRVFLWSLLLVIPGIYKAYQYRLSGVAFFAEKKRSAAAITRSKELVANGWLTTFAAYTLWNIMTLGLIRYLIEPAAAAELYCQFRHSEKSNTAKPPAHWLSHATLYGTIGLFVFLLLLGITVAIVASQFN